MTLGPIDHSALPRRHGDDFEGALDDPVFRLWLPQGLEIHGGENRRLGDRVVVRTDGQSGVDGVLQDHRERPDGLKCLSIAGHGHREDVAMTFELDGGR
jgi:hypothetical protein